MPAPLWPEGLEPEEGAVVVAAGALFAGLEPAAVGLPEEPLGAVRVIGVTAWPAWVQPCSNSVARMAVSPENAYE